MLELQDIAQEQNQEIAALCARLRECRVEHDTLSGQLAEQQALVSVVGVLTLTVQRRQDAGLVERLKADRERSRRALAEVRSA